MVAMLKEARDLEENGIVFSIAADSFLTVQKSEEYKAWLNLPEDVRIQKDEASFLNVGIRFWMPADMLAQCSLLGQRCAGNLYCGHCSAHKDMRHIPFELRLVKERVNFGQFVDSVHMLLICTLIRCGQSTPSRVEGRIGSSMRKACCS